jgi:hypothetical protein
MVLLSRHPGKCLVGGPGTKREIVTRVDRTLGTEGLAGVSSLSLAWAFPLTDGERQADLAGVTFLLESLSSILDHKYGSEVQVSFLPRDGALFTGNPAWPGWAEEAGGCDHQHSPKESSNREGKLMDPKTWALFPRPLERSKHVFLSKNRFPAKLQIFFPPSPPLQPAQLCAGI